MRKIVLNICDATYEKLRFESIDQEKSINDIIKERIFYKPFSEAVEEAFSAFIDIEVNKLSGGE